VRSCCRNRSHVRQCILLGLALRSSIRLSLAPTFSRSYRTLRYSRSHLEVLVQLRKTPYQLLLSGFQGL
jgi:hypothetical protein